MGVWSVIKKVVGAIAGRKTTIQAGKENVSAQSGNGGSTQQTVIRDIHVQGGQVIVFQGGQAVSHEAVGDLTKGLSTQGTAIDPLSQQKLEVTGDNEVLERQRAAAVPRAEAGEVEGLVEARAALEELRRNGETGRLLKFLLRRRQLRAPVEPRAEKELMSLNREVAAVAFLRGDIETAWLAVQQILEALPEDVFALCGKGHIHSLRGELDAAKEVYCRALDLSKSKHNREGESVACSYLGSVHGIHGDLDEAERMFRKALEIDEALGRREGKAIQYGNLGVVYRARGDLDEAERMYRKALELNEQLGRREDMASQYGNLGDVYLRRGDLDEAEPMLRKALEINEQLGHREGMASQYGNLGNLFRVRGDLDEGERMCRKALEIDERLGRKEGMASQYSNLGHLYFTRGDLDEAEGSYRKSLEIDQQLGRKEGMGSDYFNLGSVYRTRGDPAKARELWLKARDLYAEIPNKPAVEEIEGWLDQLDRGGAAHHEP